MNKPRVTSSHAADLAVSAEELALLKVNSPELGKPTPQSVTSGLHTLDQLIAEIRSDAFSGLENFCKIPPAYTKCLLDFDFRPLPDDDSPEALAAFNPEAGVVINPHTVHLDTINLFKACLSGLPEFCYERDPLRPRFGAYLFGPPGSGKTHLMAAFAGALHRKLDERLDGAFKGLNSMVRSYYKEYAEAVDRGGPVDSGGPVRWNIEAVAGSSKQQRLPTNPADLFALKCNELRERMKTFHVQPTDILYVGFDSLCAMYQDSAARAKSISVLESAPVVFIDDLLVPKDQEDRLEVAKALIENRLANNRIATFITSNVSPDELDTGAAVLNQRLRSRCRELYIPLDFSGVPDWRQEIRARKNLQLLSQVQSATAHQVEQLLERAMAAGLGERWGQRDAQKAT